MRWMVLVTLLGCAEPEPIREPYSYGESLPPVSYVEPDLLEFDAQLDLDAPCQEVRIHNAGEGHMEIVSLTLDDADAPFSLSLDDVLLEPHQLATACVGFEPLEARPYETELRIFVNDPDRPEWTVRLVARR